MTLLDAYSEQRVLNNNYQDVAAWKLGGTNIASSTHFNSEHLFYGPLKSEHVFLTRVDSSVNDIIIMYKGSYRTFEYSKFPLLINNLLNYING